MMSTDTNSLLLEPPTRRYDVHLETESPGVTLEPGTAEWQTPSGRVMTTVLVVDDERDVRISLRLLLEFYGYRVIEAANGAEALALLGKAPVSYVITDLDMPHMSGIELLRRIRSRAPARPRTVAMSGIIHLAQSAPAAAASLLGADVVLDKPFTRQQLLQALAMTFDQDRY